MEYLTDILISSLIYGAVVLAVVSALVWGAFLLFKAIRRWVLFFIARKTLTLVEAAYTKISATSLGERLPGGKTIEEFFKDSHSLLDSYQTNNVGVKSTLETLRFLQNQIPKKALQKN